MKRMLYIERALFACIILLISTRLFAVGFTPTDGGLVVNLETGDRFLLSVWLDLNNNKKEDPGEEFFVSNYNRYTGGHFNYPAGSFMKLLPATEITEMNEWTVGAPLERIDVNNLAKEGKNNNYALGAKAGTFYTIWNDGKTLKTQDNHYKFTGDLTDDYHNDDACEVVFVIPTDHEGITSFDPNKTLTSVYKRTDQDATTGRINGKIGKGFLGMTYREVYLLNIPRFNPEVSYTNASLVTFNTTNKQQSWANGDIKCNPGYAAYAFADDKHKKTHRMLFRLYLLDKPFNYCDNYFFATDEQDYMKYRRGPGGRDKLKWSDSTALKKIYTVDWMYPMTREGSTQYHKTDYMNVPTNDSAYLYVGYKNDYRIGGETMGSGDPGAHSQFENIRTLPLQDLPSFKAPAGAYGKMVVDTTVSDANLGVKFEPAGYFLKVETSKNVRMHETGDNKWTSEEMWTITGEYAALRIKTMLMTGPQFREDDPGAAVEGWTKWVRGDSVPTSDGKSIKDKSGYAQITVNNTDSNGHMVFILADNSKWIRYHNNGFMGLEMPKQYPLADGSDLTIMAPRIKTEYTFLGWNTKADGSGDTLKIGDKVNLATLKSEGKLTGDTVLNLYALARYDGTLQVAISFINPADDKRYFLTHPNTDAPRFARARHFDSWENTWQGMEDAENRDPNYLSTYELRCPVDHIHKKGEGVVDDLYLQEHALDPRQDTMKGYVDSLIFYEHFHPNYDEYLGLYYDRSMNTILANSTWAGLFRTTSDATELSWPNYKVPYIDSTKIYSTRYVEEYDKANKPDSLILKNRKDGTGWLPAYVKYIPSEDRFDGTADEKDGTDFQISAVIVADEHYIILPDTTHDWNDTITFGYHKNEQLSEDVWSSLIGKQLMAVMVVEGDTVYFHPNNKKTISDPNNLYLSPNYRITQVFEFIHDSRVSESTPLQEGDSAMHEATDYHWHNNIVSGMNSPLNVKNSSDQYIDIVDTFRITISHDAISKIKEYRGRWKKGATGLKLDNASGSVRHRDIIIRTKTYHEEADQTRLILQPTRDHYTFSPLAGMEKQINFLLIKQTYHLLKDKDGNLLDTVVTARDTIEDVLNLNESMCTLKGIKFDKIAGKTTGDHVTLATHAENTLGADYDTLTVTIPSIKVGDDTYTTVTSKVPLVQAALTTNELIWSVYDEENDKRYFIMAVSDGTDTTLQFREFTHVGSMLYRLGDKTQLVKGSNAGNNSDGKYITPWTFAYNKDDKNQLSLQTQYGIGKYFATSGGNDDDTGILGRGAVLFTYRIAEVNTNDNSNYEEKVRIKYLTDKWLKFKVKGGVPSIVLQSDSASATVFSWSYLLTEYSLLNNGTYPSETSAEFGYNVSVQKAIQTRYMAQREYSMLLDDELTYLAHIEETNIDNLTSGSLEWLTNCTIDTIRDRRVATSSGIDTTFNRTTLTVTAKSTGASPTNITYGGEGKYINIVDTLRVRLSLQEDAPAYRFKGDWSSFKSISDANLKIPLIRKTYHTGTFSTLTCKVEGDDDNYTFPATITPSNDTHDYVLNTILREGTHALDVNEDVVAIISEKYIDVTKDNKKVSPDTIGMHLNNKQLAEVRLMDIYGNTPDWCEIDTITSDTITVKCTKDGIYSPRTAYIYLAYIISLNGSTRFVNYRLTVSQASQFEYANNQTLVHSPGASGDPVMTNGMQQVHENKRILYYYPDQDVELPVRERSFYGWWRWYRMGVDVDSVNVTDTDVPDSLWRVAPRNSGKSWNIPFRTIGDSVMLKKKTDGTDSVKVLVTMGRWTVFHYKSRDYGNKNDPPAKNPRVAPPDTIRAAGPDRGKRPVVTYAVDISNYYDNLPMSLKDKNQVDQVMLDTMREILEPTLSLREVFELRPWTEMADTLDHYKSANAATYELKNEKYMEDHVMMAPRENPLLLRTEQRYIYEHLLPTYDKNGTLIRPGHSESLLGYYMHDDNWSSMPDTLDKDGWSRRDSMIWCGGWDATCKWYLYEPSSKTYTECEYPVSEEEDFLKVPARKGGADTVYFCLRARSMKTTGKGTTLNPDTTVEGDYWFNICRYKICYHYANIYGPKVETKSKKETRALISKDEIEQRYDVLERLDFDYVQPGSGYSVYPHPLPWADASYGYTYPETSSVPHNRYHNESDFPNHGEYGLVNRIPYSAYWRKIEQHGGAENGYMIYCDGMSSAGQVAALTLHTHLCSGQKMFFSGYVGNPSSQTGKSNPSFIFSVQGSTDGNTWNDITSYMTGDIPPSDNWYQIRFPILHNEVGKDYEHFRVRIYNVAANFDGNDFIIDDMCIFATKQPLIAYQANTTCKEYGADDADAHVILRVDYQGITGEGYNDTTVCYTMRQMTKDSVYSYVPMTDHYLDEKWSSKKDTLYGKIFIPAKTYDPVNPDSIYRNMNLLIARFDETFAQNKKDGVTPIVREGYIYEILEGDIRPVKYIVHTAHLDTRNEYTVHISGVVGELLSSLCGMTSHLKVSNRMVLELDGEEQPETEQFGLCANSTYDISLRVKGTMYRDSVAPIDVVGSCYNDWLLYGDTAAASSRTRYGYTYADIKAVVTDILRYVPASGERNTNRFATNLSAVSRIQMQTIQEQHNIDLETDDQPYDVLAHLVNNGFLQLYKEKMTASVSTGDSVQMVILPIVGTGSKSVADANVDVCPNPIFLKLKAKGEGGVPLMVGGLHRSKAESQLPVEVLASESTARSKFKLRVDSIMPMVGIYTIALRSTDDPDYREGLHSLKLVPDKSYPSEGYYLKGDSILLRPASTNTYQMKAGYKYTFNIVMQTWSGMLKTESGCEVGTVPFTLSVVPDYLRWDPKSTDNNRWNDADNWLGIDEHDVPIHDESHFVPMEHTRILIKEMTDGKPYPVVQPLPSVWADSVQKVNFRYNQCDVVRFMPGAAIGQQQRMTYTDAVIDMPIPQRKWALRGAPIKGMLSGDLYMANADLANETPLWEVGEFDMNGRSYIYANATFWLSVYARDTKLINQGEDSTRTAKEDWSKVTNGLTLPLLPANGFAVYVRTASEADAAVRLPKHDDEYYYYGSYGERLDYKKESDLQDQRATNAGGVSNVGKLSFHAESEDYTISNDRSVETESFVFGNPTMGYVDIWGFIDDNCLKEEFEYLDAAGIHQQVSRESALATTNRISELTRYLPPQHAIVVKLASGKSDTLNVTLNANRIVTETSQVIPSVRACPTIGGDQATAHAPKHQDLSHSRGIMTVTALNPVSPRCNSRLLLGQGYHNTILDGEDALLTTFNIDNFHMTNTPTTPFNIYAAEGNSALSIDLLDSIVNVPISLYMSALPYEPTTQLWFTGVNNIDGQLVLYDALTDTERPIVDGICITIETPTQNHERRYYIRRPGYSPEEQPGITTGIFTNKTNTKERAIKFIRDNQVLILREGHVYTMFGQKIQ